MEELSLSGEDLYELMESFLTTGLQSSMKIQCMGWSMSPFIRNENSVTLRPLDESRSLKNGDIVAAAVRDRRRVIVHRIIKSAPPEYLIKGDNNSTSDGWFSKNDILGLVERIENKNGFSYSPKRWQNIIIALASRVNFFSYRRILLKPCKKY